MNTRSAEGYIVLPLDRNRTAKFFFSLFWAKGRQRSRLKWHQWFLKVKQCSSEASGTNHIILNKEVGLYLNLFKSFCEQLYSDYMSQTAQDSMRLTCLRATQETTHCWGILWSMFSQMLCFIVDLLYISSFCAFDIAAVPNVLVWINRNLVFL